jgi:hypothetical protein
MGKGQASPAALSLTSSATFASLALRGRDPSSPDTSLTPPRDRECFVAARADRLLTAAAGARRLEAELSDREFATSDTTRVSWMQQRHRSCPAGRGRQARRCPGPRPRRRRRRSKVAARLAADRALHRCAATSRGSCRRASVAGCGVALAAPRRCEARRGAEGFHHRRQSGVVLASVLWVKPRLGAMWSRPQPSLPGH